MNAPHRPLALKRYKDVDLARGMRVKDGTEGFIEVVAQHRGVRRSKSFPLHSTLIERLGWQHQMVEQLRLAELVTEAESVSLKADVTRYLESLPAVQRARAGHWLTYWVQWYGHARRDELTLGQVQAFFEFVRPKTDEGKVFSASSKNKLRSYLLSLWRFHDGPDHRCPVRLVPKFPEPEGELREVSKDAIEGILSSMEDTPNRARLGLLYVTGMRPAEMGTLAPESFDLEDTVPCVWVKTAKGGKDRMIPLPPRGVAYARDFLRHEAWATPQNLRRDMRRAAKRAGVDVTKVTPYALRHAYAMNLRRAGAGDLDLADAMGHRSLQTTRRYAQATSERQVMVAAKMWEKAGMA
jgi:integrase